MLDVGQSEDWLALQIAMAPCLIGYGHIAQRLHADPLTKREGNIYWKWIENYVAEDFVEAVLVGSGMPSDQSIRYMTNSVADLIERHAVLQSPSRIEELAAIFIHATKVGVPPPNTSICGWLTRSIRRWKQGFGIWEIASDKTIIDKLETI
jgi:thiaminase